MTLQSRLLLGCMTALFFVGTHWHAYRQGQARERDAQAAAHLTVTQAQAARLVRQIDNQTTAQHAHTQTLQTAAALHADNRATVERLRGQLAAAIAAASAPAPGVDHCPASHALHAAMAADLATLAEHGAAIARAADTHAADALMLQQVCSFAVTPALAVTPANAGAHGFPPARE